MEDVPDVFFHRFVSRQEKWHSPEWLQKLRLCDDGTSCGVNGALETLSHVDSNTLDRFAESAAHCMQRLRAAGYTGGFSCALFDHD